jgi:NADH:ubiquinone reductase (non-electrogenic)
MFSKSLIEYTENHLIESKVHLLKNTAVKSVQKDSIIVQDKNKQMHTIPYGKLCLIFGLLVWATGNTPREIVSDLIKQLPQNEQNQRLLNFNIRRGLVVSDYLKVKGCDDVFALGDASATRWAPTAQVASGQGRYLASYFNQLGRNYDQSYDEVYETVGPFNYNHLGSLAYIGADRAIADLPGGIKSTGLITHFVWRSAYLSK